MFIVHALNNFVDNYETLSYAAVNTARLKRSAAGDESPYSRPVRIRFNSYNRYESLSRTVLFRELFKNRRETLRANRKGTKRVQ